MEKKIKELLISKLNGLAKEIVYNGFKNYSQREFAERLLKISEELNEAKDD